MRLDKVCGIYQFGRIGCLLSIEEDAKRIIWNLDQHGNFNRKPNREPHSRVSLYTAQSIHPLAAPTATKQWTRHRVEQLINACGKLFSPLHAKKLVGVICISEVPLLWARTEEGRRPRPLTKHNGPLLQENCRIIIVVVVVYGSFDEPIFPTPEARVGPPAPGPGRSEGHELKVSLMRGTARQAALDFF